MSDFEVCSLSPVCASAGETAHRSFEPATGHWSASAQERRTQIPTTWLSIPRTNTCNRWESSICLSLGSRRPHAWMYPCAQFVRKVRHEFMLAVKCRRNSEEMRQEMDWPYYPRPPEPLLAHYLSKLNQDRCVYFVQPFKRLIVHVSSVILKKKQKQKKTHLFNSMPLKMVLKRLCPISSWIGSASKTQHTFLPWTWWGCSGKDQQTGKSLYLRNCGLKKKKTHNP